jgi:hypothetical protein
VIVLRALSFDDCPHVIDAWYGLRARDEDVRAELDVLMMYLRQQPREGWTRPRYDILRGADGIGEIRFRSNRIEQRWFGYFGPGRNEFTFLLSATKTNRYEPRNAIVIARERRKVVVADPRRSVVILGRWGQ